MLRRFAFLSLLVLLASEGRAQHQSFLGPVDHSGGAGSLVTRWVRAASGDGLALGTEGGWIINHRFVLGGTVMRAGVDAPLGGGRFGELSMLEGGLLAAVHATPGRRMHPVGQLVLGAGRARLRDGSGESLGRTAYLVAQPSGGLSANVYDFVRLEATAGARLVLSRSFDALEQSHLGGPFAQVALVIGVY